MEKEKVPYSTICSCNPANGGSGICGCVIANQLVDPYHYGKTNWAISTQPSTFTQEYWEVPQATDKQLEEFNEYLHMLADMKTVNLKRKKKLLADYLNNL